MMKNVLLLSALFSGCNQVAAQVHQHGQGQLFVSQENSDWHVQFILPAADVLGFEHAPENAQQENTLLSLIERLDKNDAIVDLGEYCTLSEVTHTLGEHSLLEHSSFEAHERESGGNGGHHDDEHHNDHNAHHVLAVHEEHSPSESHHDDNHDDEHKEPLAGKEPSAGEEPSVHGEPSAHKELPAGKKPLARGKHTEHKDVKVEYHFTCDASNKTLSVALFQWLPSLSRIQAQWITDAGQGTATLTPASPDLEW